MLVEEPAKSPRHRKFGFNKSSTKLFSVLIHQNGERSPRSLIGAFSAKIFSEDSLLENVGEHHLLYEHLFWERALTEGLSVSILSIFT